MSERLHYALGEVLAELFAAGAITTVETRDAERVAVRQVSLRGSSNGESVEVPWPVPNLSPGPLARWRLVRPDGGGES